MNIKKVRTAVVVFGMIVFFSNSSFGQSQNRQQRKEPPTFKELIKEMDANDDDKLSKDEIKGPLKNDFSKVDADEDGFITEEEFEKAPKPKRSSRKQK